MQPDPTRLEEMRAWLTKARTDLRAAEHDMIAVPPLLDDVLFHCQQAIEKSLKAFLVLHDQPFRKTHSLEELGEQCLKLDVSLKPVVDRAVPLTEYAWSFRYPGEAEEPSLEEAQAALAIAGDALKAILERSPSM